MRIKPSITEYSVKLFRDTAKKKKVKAIRRLPDLSIC